jgi:phosphopantetheinyl transferase
MTLHQNLAFVTPVFFADEQPAIGNHVQVLDGDERQRLKEFGDRETLETFVIMRSRLKALVADVLKTAVTAVRLKNGQNGKLELLDCGPWHVSISHSEELGVVALMKDRRVGIDLQVATDDLDLAPIAERCFARSEIELIRQLPSEEATERFFQTWTDFEARVKTVGGRVADGSDQLTSSNHVLTSQKLDFWQPRAFCSIAAEGKAQFDVAFIKELNQWNS